MPIDQNRFTLLQLSDVVLDARESFDGLNGSAVCRQQRNAEALEALIQFCQIARERQPDAMIIAGNLWDASSIAATTVASVVEAFASLNDIPVLICPGRRDPFNAQSLYNARVLAAHAVKPWSKNVHIFSDADFSFWLHPLRSDLSVTSRGWIGHECARPLVYPAVEGRTNILLDYETPPGFSVAGDNYKVAFDQRRFEAFRYIAFGGSSNYSELRRDDGSLRGLASGSMICRSTAQVGPRHALWVELFDQDNQQRITVDGLPSDSRQLHCVSVAINGISNIAQHILQSVKAAGVRENKDLVHLRLSGLYKNGTALDIQLAEFAEHFYQIVVENRTRPDYALEKFDSRTTAGRFVSVMQEMKFKAESKGGALPGTSCGADLSSKIIEDALFIGLDALHHKKVNVADAD